MLRLANAVLLRTTAEDVKIGHRLGRQDWSPRSYSVQLLRRSGLTITQSGKIEFEAVRLLILLRTISEVESLCW